jgi:hypothetical protein
VTKMSSDVTGEWLVIDDIAPAPQRCLWVKITQLLGEVSCYLLAVHDGDHCSADWMEWS